MHKHRLSGMTVVAAAAMISGSALAGIVEQTIVVPDTFFDVHTTAFGNDPVVNYQLPVGANNNAIIGLRISFDYDEVNAAGNPALDASWASDLGMIIDFGGTSVGFGGSFRNLGALAGAYTAAAATAAVDVYDIWDFDGSGSGTPGFYSHEFFFADGIMKPDQILVALTDTWDGNTLYSNFQITLLKVPGPGALALLGLAGLAGARRRRA